MGGVETGAVAASWVSAGVVKGTPRCGAPVTATIANRSRRRHERGAVPVHRMTARRVSGTGGQRNDDPMETTIHAMPSTRTHMPACVSTSQCSVGETLTVAAQENTMAQPAWGETAPCDKTPPASASDGPHGKPSTCIAGVVVDRHGTPQLTSPETTGTKQSRVSITAAQRVLHAARQKIEIARFTGVKFLKNLPGLKLARE